MPIILFCLLLLVSAPSLRAQSQPKQRRPLAIEMGATLGSMITMDHYQSLWMQGKNMQSLQLGLRWRSPTDSAHGFERDYGFPELALQLSWGNFSAVTMHKEASPLWGQLQTTPYRSNMGKTLSVYGQFSRPIFRHKRWNLGYAIEEGISFNTRPYDALTNADNELTGSPLLIHFGASLWASHRIASQWALRADLAFRHLSNGATDRPNKGANWVAPSLTLQYDLSRQGAPTTRTPRTDSIARGEAADFPHHLYYELTAGVGAKTLLEDWLLTQYNTPPSSPQYRTGNFQRYAVLTLQGAAMYRYRRRWASGLGFELSHLGYAQRLRSLNAASPSAADISPISVGIAARHEAFYHSLSLSLSLGYYLYRHTGALAATEETPYYERVALRYHLPLRSAKTGLSATQRLTRPQLIVGMGVKAHATKADFAELSVGCRF